MKRMTKLLPIISSLPPSISPLLGFYSSRFRIDFRSAVLEFFSLPPQSVLDRTAFINCVLFRVAPHVFCYLHAAKCGPHMLQKCAVWQLRWEGFRRGIRARSRGLMRDWIDLPNEIRSAPY